MAAETDILDALTNNDVDHLDALHREGTSFAIETNGGQTILAYALLNHATDAALQLIRYGADVDECGTDGETALTTVCSADGNYKSEIEFLVFEGADVDATNSCDITPLMCGIENGNIPCVQTLLYLGADINKSTFAYPTPATLAIRCKETRILEILFEYGADLDLHGHNSVMHDPPLFAALEAPDAQIADIFVPRLLGWGADINIEQNSDLATPFLCSMAFGHYHWAMELLLRGCFVYYMRPTPAPSMIVNYLMMQSANSQRLAELVLVSGECFTFDDTQVQLLHSDMQVACRDHTDVSLAAIARRFLRSFLLRRKYNLLFQVVQLPITHTTKNYLLFK